MEAIKASAAPLGRLLMGGFWIYNGYGKIFRVEGLQGYMEANGVPGLLVYAVIALELIGGAMILLGFHSRLAAFALAGFSILAGLIFHTNFADSTQTILFLKNIAIAGGLLMIVAHGPGKMSINQN